MDEGEWARVETGRWRMRLLTNPGKRCSVTWIRVIVMEREVVRF